jgi:hypothetical protein
MVATKINMMQSALRASTILAGGPAGQPLGAAGAMLLRAKVSPEVAWASFRLLPLFFHGRA